MTRIAWLRRLKDVADHGHDQSSRLKALVELGKGLGYYAPEKVQHCGTGIRLVIEGVEPGA